MKGSLQEKNKKYYAVFRVNGRQKWVSLDIPFTKENKQKAEKALQKILLQYSNNPDGDMLFVDYLDMWIAQIKPLVKPSTYEGYYKVVNNKLKPYFANKNYTLNDLKGMYFTEYFTHLKERGKSNGSGGLSKKAVLNIRGVLSSALNYAVENDLIPANYIERSRLPIFEHAQFEPIIYTAEQAKNLLECAEQTQSKACLFLYLVMATGARKGELCALTWNDVDFENGTLHICRNRTGSKKEVLDNITTPKTANSVRTIPLSTKVINMLKIEKEQQEKNRRLFSNDYKTYEFDFVLRQADGSIYYPSSINRIITKLTKEAGLPHCRIHDFRHTVASILFENETPITDVTTLLGHSETQTTERIYIHKKTVARTATVQTLCNAIGV